MAIYDHDEGRAVTGGFSYRGRIAALRDSSSSGISKTRDGELILTSRQDGMIRMLVPEEWGRRSAHHQRVIER